MSSQHVTATNYVVDTTKSKSSRKNRIQHKKGGRAGKPQTERCFQNKPKRKQCFFDHKLPPAEQHPVSHPQPLREYEPLDAYATITRAKSTLDRHPLPAPPVPNDGDAMMSNTCALGNVVSSPSSENNGACGVDQVGEAEPSSLGPVSDSAPTSALHRSQASLSVPTGHQRDVQPPFQKKIRVIPRCEPLIQQNLAQALALLSQEEAECELACRNTLADLCSCQNKEAVSKSPEDQFPDIWTHIEKTTQALDRFKAKQEHADKIQSRIDEERDKRLASELERLVTEYQLGQIQAANEKLSADIAQVESFLENMKGLPKEIEELEQEIAALEEECNTIDPNQKPLQVLEASMEQIRSILSSTASSVDELRAEKEKAQRVEAKLTVARKLFSEFCDVLPQVERRMEKEPILGELVEIKAALEKLAALKAQDAAEHPKTR
ncbi:hypothetical protein Pelo_10610 [Pelomyxa schiedti]|nr:hypothetical protein Pelo_10610 [Pelomyxa schiedti]